MNNFLAITGNLHQFGMLSVVCTLPDAPGEVKAGHCAARVAQNDAPATAKTAHSSIIAAFLWDCISPTAMLEKSVYK
jgi:hypothetical protein